LPRDEARVSIRKGRVAVEAEPGYLRLVRRALFVVMLVACVVAAPARAEMPQNTSAPAIGGRVAVGDVLLGHNGTWLYADGSSCRWECTFSFRWERCASGGCRTVSWNRGYRPRLADLGRELRLAVTATKHDCGEWNYAAGTQECAWVARSAHAPPVFVRTRGRVAAAAVAWPARLTVERAAVRRGVLRATVADTLGRLVVGARVTVTARGRAVRARSRADGSVVVRVPANGPRVVVARAGTKAARVRIR
jgi:hypothetical protein